MPSKAGEVPDTPFYRKVRAIERHFGMDEFSDKLLLRIARQKAPQLPAERWAAVLIIYVHKLPIPVPSGESEGDPEEES